MPCPPGDPASKPLLGPCGGGASQGPLRAGLRGPRHLSAEASASCGRNWPGPDVCPDSQGPAPGTNPQAGTSPTGAGTPGRPQSSVSRPRADSRLGVTGEPPTSPQAKPARPQAGRGVTGGESPSSWQATPTRPQAGGGPRRAPRGGRRALTFVAPVDAGDLDLLRGDVLLHKLLALQPVPQRCLARVPVPADHDLHWESAQVRQTVRAKGRLPPPRACTHTTCTRVPLCLRAGSPGERGSGHRLECRQPCPLAGPQGS